MVFLNTPSGASRRATSCFAVKGVKNKMPTPGTSGETTCCASTPKHFRALGCQPAHFPWSFTHTAAAATCRTRGCGPPDSTRLVRDVVRGPPSIRPATCHQRKSSSLGVVTRKSVETPVLAIQRLSFPLRVVVSCDAKNGTPADWNKVSSNVKNKKARFFRYYNDALSTSPRWTMQPPQHKHRQKKKRL